MGGGGRGGGEEEEEEENREEDEQHLGVWLPTIMHERLHSPQFHVDNKATEVAGNMWVEKLL